MDQLSLKYSKQVNVDGGIYYDIEFFINGRSFLEMVKECESKFAGKLAGEYTNNCYTTYTKKFLLGHAPEYGDSKNKTELLVCVCGCPGCWPLATHIYIDGNTVVWSQFEQPHRDWVYADFGPFYFDLEQYKNVIQQIENLA